MASNPDFSRLDRVLRMEGEPDRVPLYEHLVDGEIMASVLGRQGSGPAYRVEFYRELGYDYVPMEICWPIQRTNFVRGEDTAWIPRAERTWVDQQHGTIENAEDYDSFPWPEDGVDYASQIESTVPLVPDTMKVIGHACGGVLENTMWLMGAKPFARALYTNERLVRSIFERVGSMILEAFSQASDVKGVGAMCLGDDMGLRTGTLVHPRVLRKYVFPWHRKICRAVQRRGLPFILHSCGNLKDVMEDLVGYVGIDAKHSFEDAITPAARMKEIWGDRVVILGGVDVDVLARRDVKTLVGYVRKVMAQCLPGGSWALGSGNSIPNYVKVDNYLAMLREGLRFGRYTSA